MTSTASATISAFGLSAASARVSMSAMQVTISQQQEAPLNLDNIISAVFSDNSKLCSLIQTDSRLSARLIACKPYPSAYGVPSANTNAVPRRGGRFEYVEDLDNSSDSDDSLGGTWAPLSKSPPLTDDGQPFSCSERYGETQWESVEPEPTPPKSLGASPVGTFSSTNKSSLHPVCWDCKFNRETASDQAFADLLLAKYDFADHKDERIGVRSTKSKSTGDMSLLKSRGGSSSWNTEDDVSSDRSKPSYSLERIRQRTITKFADAFRAAQTSPPPVSPARSLFEPLDASSHEASKDHGLSAPSKWSRRRSRSSSSPSILSSSSAPPSTRPQSRPLAKRSLGSIAFALQGSSRAPAGAYESSGWGTQGNGASTGSSWTVSGAGYSFAGSNYGTAGSGRSGSGGSGSASGGSGGGNGDGRPPSGHHPSSSTNSPPVQSIFRRLELVGRGAYGAVYRGVHVATGTAVALKVVNLDTPEDDVEDIQHEVALLSQLKEASKHNVVRYWGCWLKGPELWIVMDFAEGGSVRTLVSRCSNPSLEIRSDACAHS